MWNGALHEPEFVGKVLNHVEANEDKYGTATRMKGMLTVAMEVRDHHSSSRSFSLARELHGSLIIQYRL